MGAISIGDAISSGFVLIRRRPAAVLLWGAVQTAVAAVTFALVFPSMGASLAEIGQLKAGTVPDPGTLNRLQGLQGLNLLMNLIQLFGVSVVYCAVFRAVIQPDRPGLGSLRVGGSELMLFVLTLGGFIAFVVGVFIVAIPAALIIGVLSLAHAAVAAGIVGVGFVVAGAGAVIYLGLRLSMIGPLLVDRRKLDFGEAWALTRGHVGSLFLIGLSVFVILVVLEVVLVVIVVAAVVGALGQTAGGLEAIPALLQQSPNVVLTRLGGLLVAMGVIGIPIYGALLAIIGAPWARAYLDLAHSPADAF